MISKVSDSQKAAYAAAGSIMTTKQAPSSSDTSMMGAEQATAGVAEARTSVEAGQTAQSAQLSHPSDDTVEPEAAAAAEQQNQLQHFSTVMISTASPR